MIFPMNYEGASGLKAGLDNAQLGFATNTLRETTYFHGELADPLVYREALGALYQVVLSDYKYRARDRVEFRAWLEQQDRKFLASLGIKSQKARVQLEQCEARIAELDGARRQRLKPFHNARKAYFNWVYERDYELQMLLDPVVTVHPDQLSFEAFSRDESTYARLAVPYDWFAKIGAFECGTTNIDFSPRLHKNLESMRSYRRTEFHIAPSGLAVAVAGSGIHKEKKIDLPESWVDGFLQVHSTMTLSLTHFRMMPVDLFNICRYLRRHKARTSPRALRYELTPGQRTRAVLEPWEHVIEMDDATPFEGPKSASVRTWGRARLNVLKRLLPVCRQVDVYLAGFGLPSVYVLDLGGITFTLALSGWTDNDWTGGAKFDLLTRRLNATAAELTQVYEALRAVRFSTDAAIGTATELGVEKCRSALSFLCQAGRAMFDVQAKVFRHRDLFMTPFSAQEAAAAVKQKASAPQAKGAEQIVEHDNVRIIARRPVSTGYKLSGSAKGNDGSRVRPLMHVDHQGQIIEASCTCSHYKKSKLTQGPCEHILALRLAHMSQLAQEDG